MTPTPPASRTSGTASLDLEKAMAHPNAKLNLEKVRRIRQNRHGKTARQLADEHGVHFRTIEKIRAFQTWSSV
ncbi:hypothetical protein D3C78_1822740 [compost metagenome]